MTARRLMVPLVFLLFAGGVAPGPGDRPTPELLVEAPEALASAARRVGSVEPDRLVPLLDLLGLERPGPPIRVILAAEESTAARNTPGWISGYAYSALGVVVLLPERAPAYPDSSLEELLLHEVAHVLIARAAPGRDVPRWLHEGLAMVAGRSWDLGDRSHMTWALLVDQELPLAEIDQQFDEGRTAASRAYAVSGAFVRDLLQRYDSGAAARILRGLALGLSLEEAFYRATGTSQASAEASFWRRHSFWYRWVPLLTSSVTLWIAVTLLALFAIRRRRQRDAEILARWEEEEGHGGGLPLPDSDDELVN